MKPVLLLLLAALSAHARVYDVTSIYRLSSGLPPAVGEVDNSEVRVEIHARTNARGFPFLLTNGSTLDPDVGSDLKKCNGQENECDWSRSNWGAGNVLRSPLETGQPLYTGTDGGNLSDTFAIQSQAEFSFLPFSVQYRDYDALISIMLTDKSADEKSGDMYVITLHGGWPQHQSHRAKLLRCSPVANRNGGSISTYTFTSNYQRNCQKILTSQVAASQYTFYGATSYFSVLVTTGDGLVDVRVNGVQIISWTDPDPIDIKHMMFGTRYMAARYTVDALPVFEMTGETATMTSPGFYPSATETCVVVDYYTSDPNGTIDLSAGRSSEKLETSFDEGSDNQGWRHARFLVALPDEDGLHFITLQASKPASADLRLLRIAGCNSQDDEDIRVISDDWPSSVVKPAFDVAVRDRAKLLGGDTSKCAHGGRQVNGTDDCVCPAGFTGSDCEKGCGTNSFGGDCLGRCSATNAECRGLLLCRPLLGCACAPGLTGPLCDQPCLPGEFGAGCTQVCGRCGASVPCDAYTGECPDGCEPGFFPPLCRHKYNMLASAPVATLVEKSWQISFELGNLTGRGSPMFYVVQYRPTSAISATWTSLPARPVAGGDAVVVAQLPALAAGRRHQTRVVLVDDDGGSYSGEDVPLINFETTCMYQTNKIQLKSSNITESSIDLTWEQAAEGVGECPTTGFELRVKMGWRWQTTYFPVETTSTWLQNLLPGRVYPAQIFACTITGLGSRSPRLDATTLNLQPAGRVSDLRVTSRVATRLEVAWNPPSNGPELPPAKYRVDYQCTTLLACPEHDCSDSAGTLETSDMLTALDKLAPLARYKVTVRALPSGRPASLLAVTLPASPAVAPASSATPVAYRDNSTLVVQWRPAASCARVNDFPLGYRYQLWRAGLVAPVAQGSVGVGHERATFDGLLPHTNYSVRVFVETASGGNEDFPLEFVAKTRATSPEAVQALAVYKRGRRMLGLRWAAPRVSYGPLRSFTISAEVSSSVPAPVSARVVVAPTPCPAWPHLFCHTLDKLQPDAGYTIKVQAQNVEVEEDGDEASVTAVTKERAPGVPSSLQLASANTTSLSVRWALPELVNGHLRSFLVNVEETDSDNATDCCQYFPMREIVVSSEQPAYHFQMSGLRAASTYLVSVSAKTVALGPSASITAHTRPAALQPLEPPAVQDVQLDKLTARLQPVGDSHLLSGQLLLLASSEDGEDGDDDQHLEVFDPWLAAELAAINQTLYLVAEFTKDDLSDGLLTLVRGGEAVRGRFGVVRMPKLNGSPSYQLVQATVLDYCGALSVGFERSELFTVPA